MPELLAALDAFMQEHRRCGEIDGGVDDQHGWLACDCGARITRPVVVTVDPRGPRGKGDGGCAASSRSGVPADVPASTQIRAKTTSRHPTKQMKTPRQVGDLPRGV